MYKVIDISDPEHCLEETYQLETKQDVANFISALIDAPFCRFVVIILRELEIASTNKDSLKGMFTVAPASFTITNGNQKQFEPIKIYRFKSKADYIRWLLNE